MPVSQTLSDNTLSLSNYSFPTPLTRDSRLDHFLNKGVTLISQYLPIFKEGLPVMALPRVGEHGVSSLALYFAPHRQLPLVFESNLPFHQFRGHERLERLSQALSVLAEQESKGRKLHSNARVSDWKYRPIEHKQNREKMRSVIDRVISVFDADMFTTKLHLTPASAHLGKVLEQRFQREFTTAVSKGLNEITNGLSRVIEDALGLPGEQAVLEHGLLMYIRALVERTPKEIRNRALWMNSFPYFAEAPDSGRFDPVIRAQHSFMTAAAEEYGCAPAIIKRVAGFKLNQLYVRTQPKLKHSEDLLRENLINFLSSAPIEKIPHFGRADSQSTANNVIYHLEQTLSFLANFPSRAITEGVRMLGANSARHWQSEENSIPYKKIMEIHDYIRMVSRATVLPWLLSNPDATPQGLRGNILERAGQITTLMLARTNSIPSLHKHSEYWHRIVGRGNSDQHFSYTSWLPLFETQITPNKFQMVPLTNSNELIIEGARHHHCVGSYSSTCAAGISHIISVRTLEGQGISTLELKVSLINGKRVVDIQQHAKAFNKPVTVDLAEAADWLVEHLNNGAIKVDWDSIDALARQRKGKELAGFDVNDKKLWDEIYEATRPFLPKQLRYPTVEEFISGAGFDTLKACITQP